MKWWTITTYLCMIHTHEGAFVEYAVLLIVFLIAAVVASVLLVLKFLLGPRHWTKKKMEPFECGLEPMTLPRGRFSIKFYLVAMLFIIFDVELIFLYPWAVNFRGLGVTGFAGMLVFLGMVVMGLLYAWRRGALDWEE